MSIDLEAELKPERSPVESMAIPSVGRRAAGASLEIFLYCVIVMVVAIIEYYAGGFTGPRVFGGRPLSSNWVIGAAIYASWTINASRRGTTPAAGLVQLTLVGDLGESARPQRVVLRQLIRSVVLYALPLYLSGRFGLPLIADPDPGWLGKNPQILWIALFVGAGFMIRTLPLGRAPWDLIAGTTMVESYGVENVPHASEVTIDDLKVSGERQAQNVRAGRILHAAGWGAILVSLLIVWVVFSEAWEFVTADDFSWGLLNIDGNRRGWFPRRDLYDIPTLLIGTAWVTGIAMLVAGPIGLGVAIYLSEYAKPKVQRIVKPVIETLASVPSVVIGMFAIFFVSPSLLTFFFDDIGIFSIVAAGIGVGILTIPLVASISEDALRAVPMELREAAYGLGSRKITVALRVVFPAALSGISAAFIVGISRAIGETMVVAIAAGGSGGTLFELDPREPGQTITAAMASLGAGTDQVAGSGIAFQSLYFLGALLFIMTLLLNVFSDAVVRRFREAY